MTRNEVMKSALDKMTVEEQKIAQRARTETLKNLSEAKLQPLTVAYGTSTPGYYAVIEHPITSPDMPVN